MLDGVTLDQLRIFIAAVEEGSFSAAARRLGRAQSVVSQTIANLEAQIGVRLFDRLERRPTLTAQGQALLASARSATESMNIFKARAKGLAAGLEPELAVVVDVMFPIDQLTAAIAEFGVKFPDTPLRLYVEALGAVLQPVLDGRCSFGIMGTLPNAPPGTLTEMLSFVEMSMVVSPHHPLAAFGQTVPRGALGDYVQLVLTDRSALSQGREFGVLSSKTWRLADLGAKHSFLKAGLGWGSMPLNLVHADLRRGLLRSFAIEDSYTRTFRMRMSAVYRSDAAPGPAGRWLIDRLKRMNEAE